METYSQTHLSCMKKLLIVLSLPVFLFSCKAKTAKRSLYADKNNPTPKVDVKMDTVYEQQKNGNFKMIIRESKD